MVRNNLIRIVGMALALIWVSGLVWLMLRPLWQISPTLFVAKDIVLDIVLTFIFVRWFFVESDVKPTARRGLELGAAVLIIGFADGFIGGFLSTVSGMPALDIYPDLPAWYSMFQFGLAVLTLVSAWATGAYLAKKH